MKQIMKWLLETLIFIEISPQSVYGKYFYNKKVLFCKHYLRRSGKRQHSFLSASRFGEFQSKIQVGVCIALRDPLQLIGTYFYSISFEQCAELTVAITITHRNVTDTACRKCKFRCSLQLNCMKQIMKWLLETLIFIEISPTIS
jgi:hypothetical protein